MTDPMAAEVRRLRTAGQARPVPRRMSLQITNLCNSRCTMCSIWEIYRKDKGLLTQELTGPEWLKLTDRAISQGVMSVDITGGEPFMKEGVAELLKLLLRRTGFAAVTTNGLQPPRILETVEDILKDAPADSLFVVSVSMDGFSDTYAKIRGIRTGYARAERLLRGLVELRERYPQLSQQMSFTIMDENVDELPGLMAHALETGLVREPDDFGFRPVASGHYYAQENGLERRDKVIRTVKELNATYRFRRTLPFIEKIPEALADPGRMILPCYAMFASVWIDPYGGVAPCVTMTEDVIGNVRDFDLDLLPVWTGHLAQQTRERIKRNECAVCWTDCQAMESLEYESAGAS
ncbi:radical SAM/SPASM domain-containing protein [Streptomyces sp. NBC_01190]|uniref:radical SAM protein n=1 Tax=Streptomyces sp. NBC_01190 TaxID=2903767 RepID=UPI0038672E9C|nr:radical SAM protein [Streptomyces sp. NBC_01190]